MNRKTLAALAAALLLCLAVAFVPSATGAPSRLRPTQAEAQGKLTGAPLLIALNNTFTFYLQGENLPQIQPANVQLQHPNFQQFEVTQVRMAKQGESFIGVQITAKFTSFAPVALRRLSQANGTFPVFEAEDLSITINNVTEGMNNRKLLTDTVQSWQ